MTAYLDRAPRDFDTAAAEAAIERDATPARSTPLSDDEADEALRLNEGGLFILQLGALFRRDYAVINKALAGARKRRADAWAREPARGVGGAAARQQDSAPRIVLPTREPAE